ncbi:MAG: hypothetical protein OXQ89_19305, partial [Rhodospirillaceae bacterium]|nr:hypothetical protein [Rhodospirillaceae bacterium]
GTGPRRRPTRSAASQGEPKRPARVLGCVRVARGVRQHRNRTFRDITEYTSCHLNQCHKRRESHLSDAVCGRTVKRLEALLNADPAQSAQGGNRELYIELDT